MNMVDYVAAETIKYIEYMPKKLRKQYGQFFTSKNTAVFMANLFEISETNETISILDPGAGAGILSAALIERLQTFSSLKKIDLVCYENDPNILELLNKNLEWLSHNSRIKIEYYIISENYILSQKQDYNLMLGANLHPQKYDLIISNPPYMKISKDAPEAIVMADVCYGAPNLYFLFASMSLFNLKENGEMVYILPRSWTSGAYFKQFRKKLSTNGVITHIHLFVSRNEVFENEDILQETIILKIKKTLVKPKNVIITTTQNHTDFSQKTIFNAPYDLVVNKDNGYIYLVTNEQDIEILKNLNTLTDTLPSLGLKMKTGLTVDFRNRESLRNSVEDQAIPLFYSQHIQNGKVIFPIGREAEYIVTNQTGLRQKNTNYLFIKRFTSKEEHRRLQCGIYLANIYSKYSEISTQNKINFICGVNELSECTVYGLYVLFNSTIYDAYYRILNGSTQVNSTEMNMIPVPTVHIIEAMGRELIRRKDMSEEVCDNILRSYI